MAGRARDWLHILASVFPTRIALAIRIGVRSILWICTTVSIYARSDALAQCVCGFGRSEWNCTFDTSDAFQWIGVLEKRNYLFNLTLISQSKGNYFMKKLSQTGNSSKKPRYSPYADLLIDFCGNNEIVTSKITF